MKRGWEVKKLGEVCKYDKTANKRIDLPYVGLENIESNTGVFTGSLAAQKVKSSTFYFNREHVPGLLIETVRERRSRRTR